MHIERLIFRLRRGFLCWFPLSFSPIVLIILPPITSHVRCFYCIFFHLLLYHFSHLILFLYQSAHCYRCCFFLLGFFPFPFPLCLTILHIINIAFPFSPSHWRVRMCHSTSFPLRVRRSRSVLRSWSRRCQEELQLLWL